MWYLTAAVALVGLLCLLDLVLTVGVIRRLREHTRLLGQVTHGGPAVLGLPAGASVGQFAATTTTGEPVSRELLSDRTLVGFFAPGCQPCAEQLPRFVEYARSMPDGQALAVVAGGAAEVTEYAQRLAWARVVTELPDGPVQAAFQVTGFPTVYLVDAGGVVAAAGMSMDSLADAPTAPAVTA